MKVESLKSKVVEAKKQRAELKMLSVMPLSNGYVLLFCSLLTEYQVEVWECDIGTRAAFEIE